MSITPRCWVSVLLASALATAGFAATPGFLMRRPPLLRDRPNDKRRTIILWVREVNRRAMYWVDHKPVGREPLTGLEIAIGPSEAPENVDLKVVLDSRVPIQEISDIDGTIAKIPITDAHYYVYSTDDPTGMSEIVWKSEVLPLPQSPPPSGKHPR